MQQIERYGVIALVFLLVTIVAVSFWGDSKSPGFWSRLTGRGDAKKMEIAKNPATAERALDNALPLTPAPMPAPAAGENANAQQPQQQQPQQPVVAAAPAQPQTAEAVIANANPPAGMQPAANSAQVPSRAPAPTPAMASAPNATPVVPAAHGAPLAKNDNAAAKKSAVANGSTVEYVVQKGDSLASIAQKSLGNSSRWTEIQSMNGGIQPKALKVGTKLKLPATAAKTALEKSAPTHEAPAPKKTSAPAAEHNPGVEYVVHAGDTLRTIAEKKLGSSDRWKDIVAANPGLDPHKLTVGKSLKIPAHEAHDAREPRDPREPRDTGALVAAATPSSSHTAGKPHVR
jgi:nucleoid-associated protein YgaU